VTEIRSGKVRRVGSIQQSRPEPGILHFSISSAGSRQVKSGIDCSLLRVCNTGCLCPPQEALVFDFVLVSNTVRKVTISGLAKNANDQWSSVTSGGTTLFRLHFGQNGRFADTPCCGLATTTSSWLRWKATQGGLCPPPVLWPKGCGGTSWYLVVREVTNQMHNPTATYLYTVHPGSRRTPANTWCAEVATKCFRTPNAKPTKFWPVFIA
jgi:hypothetical protein